MATSLSRWRSDLDRYYGVNSKSLDVRRTSRPSPPTWRIVLDCARSFTDDEIALLWIRHPNIALIDPQTESRTLITLDRLPEFQTQLNHLKNLG